MEHLRFMCVHDAAQANLDGGASQQGHLICKYHTLNDVFAVQKCAQNGYRESDDELIQSDNKIRIGTISGNFIIMDGT